MAIPAYLWLKDDGGASINGSVDVKDLKTLKKKNIIILNALSLLTRK